MDTTVQIVGLEELRKGFRKAGGPQLSRALGKAHKSIANKTLAKVKPAVQGLPSPGGSKAIRGIKASGTQKEASIKFSKSPTRPVMATILGSNWHTLWGKRTVPTSSMRNPVWKPHMGSSWTPASLYGAGPVFVAAHKTFVMDDYEKAIADTLRDSF